MPAFFRSKPARRGGVFACMPRTPAQLLRGGLVWLLLPPLIPAAAKPPLDIESSEGQVVFSLLPKSFQSHPPVDQTVLTEMTDEGRKLPLPSRDQPAYYFLQPGDYRIEGEETGNERPPPPGLLAANLQRALAMNNYRPAAPGHPPSLLIIFHWGAHNNLGEDFPDIGHRNLLSRAALIGGKKFAEDLKQALAQQDRDDEIAADLSQEFQGMLAGFGAMKRFTNRDGKTMQLVEESKAECYYVIASAYDYAAVTQGKRVLLWRSKMTVDSAGVNMADTLPGLIQNAARYFGRDMPEPATISRPINREEQIRLGPMEVQEYLPDKPAGKP